VSYIRNRSHVERFAAVTFAGGMGLLVSAGPLSGSANAAMRTVHSSSVTNASTVPAPQLTNLLTGSHATFNGTTGGWIGWGANLSWASSPSQVSSGSLAITAPSAGFVSAWSGTAPSATPATPGRLYVGSADVTASSGAPQTQLVLAFFGSSGSALYESTGSASGASGTSWSVLPEVVGIAPPGSVSVALVVYDDATSAGQRIYVDSPVLASSSTAAGASVNGPLKTSGNRILDANGQPVALHGVNIQLTTSSDLAYATEDAIQTAKAWGANFIRLELDEGYWMTNSCYYLSSYQSEVDQLVSSVTSLGMVALLDLHFNQATTCDSGGPGPHNMADAVSAPTFWAQVAQRYGNPSSPEYSPLAAFDLYNEPHSISSSVWLNGGTTTDTAGGGQTYQAAGVQQLYNAVRGAGASGLVFVSGPNWANSPPPSVLSGTNLVYAVHYYTCPSNPPPSCSNANYYDPSQVLNNWVAFSSKQPVVETEFGWPSPADGIFIANSIAFDQSHGWGWAAFTWEQAYWTNGTWDLAYFFSNGPDAAGEPNASGMPVLLAMSGVPSISAPQSVVVPSLSGTVLSGKTLSSSTGSWSGSPNSYAYDWLRCKSSSCVQIAGATGPTYVIQSTDVGYQIASSVTACNLGCSSANSRLSVAVPTGNTTRRFGGFRL
jgi:endoglucanase